MRPKANASALAPSAPPRSAPGQPGVGRLGVTRPAVGRVAEPSREQLAGRARRMAGTTAPRMRFALLVLILLGGGLICLLVINTTLGAASFRISRLQQSSATLATQEQALQQQIAAERSPALIARRAYQLGMRVEPNGYILDLATHRFDKLASQPGATIPFAATGVTSTVATGTTAKASAAKKRSGKARA